MTTTTNAVASDLLQRNRARLARAEARLSSVREAKAPFTETKVLRPFKDVGIELAGAGVECSVMAEVRPDAEVREAADRIVQELSAFGTRLGQERPLYEALGGLDAAALDPIARRVVELARRDLRRPGIELGDAGQETGRTVGAGLRRDGHEFGKKPPTPLAATPLAPSFLAGRRPAALR